MTVGRGCCGDRSIPFDFGLPGTGAADDTDDTDSSDTAEAARDSRFSGLVSSLSAEVVATGGGAAVIDAVAVVVATAVVGACVAVTGSAL